MILPVFMYAYENWTIKKAECWRTDIFKLWCWRRLFWTARRLNQSILKEINPEYSLEGVMLKLKLQYFDHLMWRADSLEKILMLRKIEGKGKSAWQRIRWLESLTDSMDMNLSKLWEIKKDREETDVLQSMGSQRVRYDLETEQQLTALNPRFTIITDTLHKCISCTWGE